MKFVDETNAASGNGDEVPAVDAFRNDWPDSDTDGSETINTAMDGTTSRIVDATGLEVHAASAPPALGIGAARLPSPTDRFLIRDDDHAVSPASGLPGFQNLSMAMVDPIPTPMPLVVPFETENEDPEVRAMRARIYREKDVWPLESREEAMLFRHYIQKLSICVGHLIASGCIFGW